MCFHVADGTAYSNSMVEEMIVTNPPDVCQVVEVMTESDEQPPFPSQHYPLQISPVSSYEGQWAQYNSLKKCTCPLQAAT